MEEKQDENYEGPYSVRLKLNVPIPVPTLDAIIGVVKRFLDDEQRLNAVQFSVIGSMIIIPELDYEEAEEHRNIFRGNMNIRSIESEEYEFFNIEDGKEFAVP